MKHRETIQALLSSGQALIDNPYRLGSEKWGELVREAREMYNTGIIDDLDEDSLHLLEGMSGELREYNGEVVMLEVPMQSFEKPEWFYVYVFDGETTQKLEFQGSVTGSEDITFKCCPEP